MIRAIELSGYKTHLKTEIVFQQITALMGDIGSGKTGVLEALVNALYGKGFPQDMLHEGFDGKPVKIGTIRVELHNGRTVLIERKGAKQQIKLIEADGSIVGDFGGAQNIAEEVQNFTGFLRVRVPDTSVDLTPQSRALTDPPFELVHGSNAAILQVVASLSTAHYFSSAQKQLASTRRAAVSTTKVLAGQIATLKEELAQDTTDYAAIEEALGQLKSIEVEQTTVATQADKVSAALQGFKRTREALDTAPSMDSHARVRQQMEALSAQMEKIGKQKQAITVKRDSLNTQASKIRSIRPRLEAIIAARKTLDAVAAEFTTCRNLKNTVENALGRLESAIVATEDHTSQLQTARERKAKVDKQLAAIPVCPTCNRPLEAV